MWADPEAAAVVFGYGGPLMMAGLDVTHQFLATPDRIERIAAIGGTLAGTLAQLLTFFSRSYRSNHEDIAGAPMHDVLAVLALAAPHLFARVAPPRCRRDDGRLTRGMTVIDRRTVRSRAGTEL